MTPKDYLKIETEQSAIIAAAKERIRVAREEAEKAKPPHDELRPAEPRDIAEGVIVWHERKEEHGGWYWHIVDEPMHYGDPFKAYCADDGCRYGLNGAFVYANVQIQQPATREDDEN
jgi:hypothetical protein